jgi:hypothetical protein
MGYSLKVTFPDVPDDLQHSLAGRNVPEVDPMLAYQTKSFVYISYFAVPRKVEKSPRLIGAVLYTKQNNSTIYLACVKGSSAKYAYGKYTLKLKLVHVDIRRQQRAKDH